MAAPPITKNWQYNVNNHVFGNPGYTVDHQKVLWGIKEAMVGFGNNPWVVRGSNDEAGNFGNNDDVDRWVAYTNLRFANSGNISWIVMEQSAINPANPPQVCFYLDYGGTGKTNGRAMTIVFSPTAGFGAANGGVDGDATNRPTATDEREIWSTEYWLDAQTSARSYYYHVFQSDDGQCTRWVCTRNNQSTSFFILDVPKNPHPGWTDPVFCGFQQDSGGPALSYGNWENSASCYANINSLNVNLKLGTEMLGSSMIGQAQIGSNINGEWPLTSMGIRSITTGARGFFGEVYDLRYCSDTRGTGDTYPSSSGDPLPEHSWVQFDSMAMPWNTDPFIGLA